MITTKHAKPLAELNRNGIKLVERWLERTVYEVSVGDRKPKVLDIGCGESLYATEDLRSRLEFHCCDRADWSKEQGECFRQKAFPWKADDDVGGPYDVIVFSAVLHELCRQRFIARIRPTSEGMGDSELTTAEWFFQSLKESGLLRPNSRVIVAELYHRDIWPYDVLLQSQKWQLKKYGHADPPCAFPDPEELIAASNKLGFHLTAFDEDFSLDEIMRNSLKSEKLDCPPAVAVHLQNRRFCCLVFSYEPNTTSSLGQIRQTRPAISTAANDHESRGLVDALKQCEASLERWNEGKTQTREVRAEYDRILAGFSSGLPNAGESTITADDKAVFPTLAVEMAKASTRLLEQLRVGSSRYHSFWLSLESRVLAEGTPQQKVRYLPSIPGQGKGGMQEQPALQVCFVSEAETSCVWTARDDWTAIAFRHLGSRDAVRTAVFEFPALLGYEPPSLFNWFSSHIGKRVEESPNRPESLTLFFGQNSWDDVKASNRIIEFGSNAASLTRWCSPDQALKGKHVFVVLDAASTQVSPDSVLMKAPVRPGALLNELSRGEYCGHTSSFETHVMESIASLYLDFQFLGACLASEDDRPREEHTASLKQAVNTYRSKWLSALNTRFIDNQATYDALLAEWQPDHSRAILPHTYRKRIEEACTVAEKHVDRHGAQLIPFSWSIFSSLDPMSHGREAPGNVMLFTDTLLPRAVLIQHRQQADDVFRAVHWLEEEAIEVRRAQSEGRDLQLVENLTSFGHDAKRWASAITGILKSGWIGSTGTARLFSESLEARLSSYARLGAAFRNNQGIRQSLSEEASRATGFTTLRDLLLVEVLPIFARICVDGRKWKTLARNLWRTADAPNEHFQRTFEHLEFPPNWSLLIPILKKANVSVNYEGPEVKVPLIVSGEGGQATTTLLSTCLRFIISELLTNAVKHQWSTKSPELIQHKGIHFTVTIAVGADELLLSTAVTPASDPGIRIGRFIGLQSIKLATQACGGTADERLLSIKGVERSLPFPTYEPASGVLTNKFRFPKEAFRCETV